jgi:hypothetical protein
VNALIGSALASCWQETPAATTILTDIFPRNVKTAVSPTDTKTDDNVARFADGKQIRPTNVDDKLADQIVRLFDGVVNSDARPQPAAKGDRISASGLTPIPADGSVHWHRWISFVSHGRSESNQSAQMMG